MVIKDNHRTLLTLTNRKGKIIKQSIIKMSFHQVTKKLGLEIDVDDGDTITLEQEENYNG